MVNTGVQPVGNQVCRSQTKRLLDVALRRVPSWFINMCREIFERMLIMHRNVSYEEANVREWAMRNHAEYQGGSDEGVVG